jgi:hypothetical protein
MSAPVTLATLQRRGSCPVPNSFWTRMPRPTTSASDPKQTLLPIGKNRSRGIAQSGYWRNFRGVTLIVRRKFTVRWLWLENPTA